MASDTDGIDGQGGEAVAPAAPAGFLSGVPRGRRRVAPIVLLALAGYAGVLAAAGAAATITPVLAVFFCAFLAGIVGFAFSALAQPVLAVLMHNPVHIVQTLMLCSLANQGFSIASLWRHMQWARLPPFLIGGVLGLPLGIYGLLHLDPREFHIAVGAIIALYGAYVLVRRPIVLPEMGRIADGVVGFAGGLIGGLCAFPGAPVTVWCGMRGWSKVQQRGIFQPYILVMQVGGLILLTIASARAGHGGMAGDSGALATIAVVPGSLAGTWLGLRIFHRISDRHFEACVAVLLMASGVLLLA
ncbi:MAG: hypothetical protein B7Z59_02610 [Acidiphilium sp. 37-67-22]|nr:MAG: hypothetical protein B7Z59_02610 [Acidiphilium sp. 37-67-22]